MSQPLRISPATIQEFFLKIKENFFIPVNTYKTTVFLCGADIKQKDKIRGQVADALSLSRFSHMIDIVYPEDIFDELLYNPRSNNLLSLENLLADSVDAVVVIPESPGSFTELGAFANNERLRKKLICVVDRKYKKNKSFINQGPLRLIREVNKERVMFIDTSNIEIEVSKLSRVLLHLKKDQYLKRSHERINLLQLDNFLLPFIYLFDPADTQVLQDIVYCATKDEENSYQMTMTALTSLSKKRFIEQTESGVKLTQLGNRRFFEFKKRSSRIKIQKETNILDSLRIRILNFRLRNKALTV